MVEEGQGMADSLAHRAVRILTRRLAVLIVMAGGATALAADAPPSVRLSEAAELGTFNVGPAGAVVRRIPDQAVEGDVLKLDYTIPQSAAAGLYAKTFPGGLDADRVDAARLAVKGEDADQSRLI